MVEGENDGGGGDDHDNKDDRGDGCTTVREDSADGQG